MPGVTRTLTNDGDPIIYPSGTVAANRTITFQLVDFEKRQPISLFDAAEDGGEYVVGSVVTATIGATGYFSVNLWPNTRGEAATLYKVLLPGTTVKPFYIQISEGAGAQTLLSAKTAVDAVAPQTLSLFDALLAQIIAIANTATALVTRTTNGLMSYQDKAKLDDLAAPDLSGLAPLDSPALTGTPTAPTAGATTNNTQIATTGFVKTAVAALVASAPSTLDTLKELADALADDPNFSTTITNSIALKAPIASPALTGAPTAPTAAEGTNSTQIATTAFVQTAAGAKAPINSPSFTTKATSPFFVVTSATTGLAPDTAQMDYYGGARVISIGGIAGGCAPIALHQKSSDGSVYRDVLIISIAGNALFGKTVDDGLAKIQSSNGITLGNTANASPLVLDWYEEGTWTPTVTFGGNSVGVAYTGNNRGTFTRIGRLVHFTVCLSLASKGSSTGAAYVRGLPYPLNSADVNTAGGAASVGAATLAIAGNYTPNAQIAANSAIGLFMVVNGAPVALTDADFANNSYMVIAGNYNV